jgi:hypothetical protein
MPPGTHPVTRASRGSVLHGRELLPPIALEVKAVKKEKNRMSVSEGREGKREGGGETNVPPEVPVVVELIACPELAAKDVEMVAETHGLWREGGKKGRKEGQK